MHAAVKGKLKLQGLHHAGNAGNEDTYGGRLDPKELSQERPYMAQVTKAVEKGHSSSRRLQ